MNRKTKAALAALFIAAVPALAQAKTYNGSHRAVHPMSYEMRAQRLIEGRNAAGFGAFNSAPSGRDALVQSLGN
jgi:hypothetical protein